jgi:hypothetical protein
VILRTARACCDTFPAILMALEDGLAQFVAFDGELRGLADELGSSHIKTEVGKPSRRVAQRMKV